MLVSIYRTTKFAAQTFYRNLWLSVITIFILILTLFTVSLVATMNLLADRAISAVEEKIDVDIYFADNTSEENIIAAQMFLEDVPEVKNVRYVSKDEALEKFKDSHADNVDIQNALEELDENPLPASLIVQANELSDYEVIMQQFNNSEFDIFTEEKNFSDQQAVIDKLSAITTRVYQVGVAVSAVFIVISVVMMFNTIRLAIYAHREELAIMKLVGATNAFIRAPFILEGAFYAVLSSAIAMSLLWLVVLFTAPYVNDFFFGYNFNLDVFFYNNFLFIFSIQFLFSLILSVGSSMISIGRYLRV
ncbi:MAG: permease-like cell division protein FtsX [bacterium]|nr:permease-like cell division protein FtsX [bacterium]